MKTVFTLNIILLVWFLGSWFTNLYKLVNCDWEAPYKDEVVHGIGVPIAPVSFVTCWFDFSDNE